MVRGAGTMPIDAWNNKVIATDAGGRTGIAWESDRLATLDSGDPIHTPIAHQQIKPSARTVQEMPAFAKRQLVSSAEVKYVTDIEVAVTVIGLNANARDIDSAISPDGCAVKEITRITPAA